MYANKLFKSLTVAECNSLYTDVRENKKFSSSFSTSCRNKKFFTNTKFMRKEHKFFISTEAAVLNYVLG